MSFTWTQYMAIVDEHLSVDANRRGLEDFRERMMRNAVVDLQRYITSYQQGHTTTYAVADMTTMENAMLGNMPIGAIPHAFYIYSSEVDSEGVAHPLCNRNRLDFWPWMQRQQLVCCPCEIRLYAYTLSPQNKTFLIHPILNEDTTLLLVWQGLKMDFDASDEVPFPEQSCEAVAAYVKWRILLEVDKNPNLANVQYGIWKMLRSALYLEERDKQDADKKDEEYEYSGGGWGGSGEFGRSNFLTGLVPVVVGQQSYSITFSPAFTTAPSFTQASLQMASSTGEFSEVTLDRSTLTASGVTAWLDGVPGAASTGAQINWIAFQ